MNKELVQNICSYLMTKPVIRGYLFGSAARGSTSHGSDIDLLLEIDYSTKVSLLDFIGWKQDLEKITSKKIDLVANDAVSKHIKPYIDKDKIIIYDRSTRR